MSIKATMILILVLLIFGILVSLMYGFYKNFNDSNTQVDKTEVNLNILYSNCMTKKTLYNSLKLESDLINLCCYKYDIDENGIFSDDEYCKGIYEFKSLCNDVNCNI